MGTNQEELIVDFLDNQYNVVMSIKNFTAFTIERDFFTPADAFTLVLADDRVYQLNNAIHQGMLVRFTVQQPNGKQSIAMYGYIFKFKLGYDSTGGTQLHIEGQDLLGFMGKGYPFPNLGHTTQTNFHFAQTDTLITAFGTICDAFTGVAQLPNKIIIGVEDGADLTFATGFATGIRTRGKTGRNLARSFQTQLGHLTTPNKGETYLSYLIRLAKHVGCNVKMSPGTNDTIIVSPPTYDRSHTTPFRINHSTYGGVLSFLSSPQDINNVLSGEITIDMSDQPSSLIVEMATQGNNAYYRNTKKCIVVNELTGYKHEKTTYTQKLSVDNMLDNISLAIKDLTTGKVGQGYLQLPPNQDLFNSLPYFALDINTEVSLPKYFIDQNAHNDAELEFGTAMAMAEAQDKFIVMNYTVDGLSQNGAVWYPNMMCRVYDNITHGIYFIPNSRLKGHFDVNNVSEVATAIDSDFWISKVQWSGDREHYQTHLTLSLPYTHIFDITNK